MRSSPCRCRSAPRWRLRDWKMWARFGRQELTQALRGPRERRFRGALRCAQLGYIQQDRISFVVKQGCTYKRLQNSDQVAKRMAVHGIRSFKAPRHRYPHPYGIIGAGYNGLKAALYLLRDQQTDFTIFDRYDKVEGHIHSIE